MHHGVSYTIVQIEQYAQERKQLMRLFVLLDARHGIKERDRYFFDFLDAYAAHAAYISLTA